MHFKTFLFAIPIAGCLYADSCECLPQCGLPNLAAQEQCHNVRIFGDCLVWNVGEAGTENWGLSFVGPNVNINKVHFGWDVGFRAGIDYRMVHDQWDTQIYYTWYRTKGTGSAGPPGQVYSAYIGNFYINNADGAVDRGAIYESASINWTIQYNILD